MFSTSTVVLTLFTPFILVWAWRIQKLVSHYLEARKIGLPVYVLPFTWQDAWWIVLRPRFLWLQGVPVLGDLIDLSHHSWAQDLRHKPHRRFGDAFVVVSPGTTQIIINDPAVVVEVQGHHKTWTKPPLVYDIFESYGPSVISVNGEDWQRHRRIINPSFREQNNKLVWEESLRQVRQMLAGVQKRRNHGRATLLDVRNDCVLIAMHVLSAAGFGQAYDFDGGMTQIPEGHSASLAESLKFLLQNIFFAIILKTAPYLAVLMPAKARQINAMSDEFQRYMREIIAYNRATTQAGGGGRSADIVSALVEADEAAKREEKTAGRGSALGAKSIYLSDAELQGNLYVLCLAGFETTANTLTYSIPFLAVNPDVQDWVGEEVDAVFEGRDLDNLSRSYEEVFPSLVRCMAVMYETLRLWGPVNTTVRWCTPDPQPLRIGDKDFLIPPETYVTVNNYGVHSDPRWWGDDSLEWRPSRWIQVDATTGKETLLSQPPFGGTYTPWSNGPRICPGKKFSQVEFVAVMATLLRGFRLKPLVDETKSLIATPKLAAKALMDVVEDSTNVITPKMRRPEDAGIVYVAR